MVRKSFFPNALTLTNLFCGCLALLSILSGAMEWVAFFVAISLFSDYTDGLVARLLKVSSPLGKELDSLADMVSFGLVPGALLYYLINQSQGIAYVDFNLRDTWHGLFGFVLTLFACLRLAKFNIDTRQAESFIGLNTPSCTLFVLGIALIIEHNSYGLRSYLLHTGLLFACTAALSYLLIAELPMFSFKFKHFAWRGNQIRLLFLFFSAWLLMFMPLGLALSVIITLYILVSLLLWLAGIVKAPTQ